MVKVEISLLDRIAALKDIVPPTTRHSLASKVSKTASFFKRTTKFAGNVIWVVTTSALLIGLPLALILEDEAKVVAQENEMLAQQQGAQQMVAGSSLYPPSSNAQKQSGQQGLVPPGF
ncbi:mitochondrial import receptor subunit Tom22-domain-containing protein [Russula vinacea]|nr:mitochondrial import receptor subunit Tom22-domain-containing protein [Russula vinacea]